MNQQIQYRRQLENDLRRALKNNELVLHYQPRYRLSDLRIVSVEALLRWQHPQEGLLAPDNFIPLAEQSGLIVALGRWVLSEACRSARDWPALCWFQSTCHLPNSCAVTWSPTCATSSCKPASLPSGWN